jgi:arabinan endo-1,5-alpha-L-arabinosidase
MKKEHKKAKALCSRFALPALLFMLVWHMGTAQNWPAGIHDPSSIVKCEDKYWVFATGDGIAAKYSTDMVTWTDGPTPFTKTNWPQWILNYAKTNDNQFEGFFWAPDIIYMNGKYYLYYSCSIWGTMSSCIGVVVNKTLEPSSPDYLWEDQGDIGIYSWVPNPLTNAIDPAVMKGPDGRVWMTYGSFNRDGIVVTQLDSITGKPKNTSRYPIANSWTGGTSYAEGEGGCMIYRNGYYYLFYNKGGCCAGIASSYYVVMGRSTSPTGPFIDKENKLLYRQNAVSGGTVVFKHDDSRGLDDRYYGPGHIGIYRENNIDYVSFHYYDPNGYYPNEAAGYKGGPTLGLAMLKWGSDGWPYISTEFLEKGFYQIHNAKSGFALDLQQQKTVAGTKTYIYAPNTMWDTQKWLFTPLGTGEYNIRSYADTTKYLEATGATFDSEIKIANAYTGAINQKFRVVKSPNDQVIIYPSTKDKIFETWAFNVSYPVILGTNKNTEQQRWMASPFIETLALTQTTITSGYESNVINNIELLSNGSWNTEISDPSWVSVTPTSGTGNATFTISINENMLTDNRENSITIRSKGGNTAVLAINQHTQGATSVSTPISNVGHVSPNPTQSGVSVTVAGKLPVEIKLINPAGTVLYQSTIHTTTTYINLSKYSKGLYLLQLSNETNNETIKIVKQ